MARSDRGLSRCLRVAGGIGVKDAVVRARDHLDALRERALQSMDENVAAIQTLCASIDGPPPPETRKTLHALCYAVAELGGTFQLEGLSKAAQSFCGLLDETAPHWNAGLAAMHAEAMGVLINPAGRSTEAINQIVAGLVRARQDARTQRPQPAPAAAPAKRTVEL